jgi:cellobiose phosphorylase
VIRAIGAAAEQRRAAAPTRGRLLGNGRLRTLLTSSGTGGAWLGNQALTSWRGDRVEDADGWFVYLRDLSDGRFWSFGARPVPGAPEHYAVEDGPGGMAIVRRDHGIEARMDVWVDPDEPAECRDLVVHNLSSQRRRIEVTTYLEVVLHDPRLHADHPGFSKLFVQTEALAERGLLLARRRPRSPELRHPWLAHSLLGEGPLSFETDRARFLGRGRGPDAPAALTVAAALSGTTGDVLDPILSLRRVVELAPRASVRLASMLAAAATRDDVLEVAGRLASREAMDASRARSVERAERRRSAHGLGPQGVVRLERLAAAALYGEPRLRTADVEPLGADGGLSFARRPALPIRGSLIVVEAGAPPAALSEALSAHAYWRELGLETTLVILTDGRGEDHSSHRFLRAPEQCPDRFIVRVSTLDARELDRLRARADLLVRDGMPSPEATAATEGRESDVEPPDSGPGDRRVTLADSEPDRFGPGPRAGFPGGPSIAAAAALEAGEDDETWTLGEEPLRCFNGFGGFASSGHEYVIRMPRTSAGPRLTPRPWINVLANPGFGALISESGAGCTWSRNSRNLRLTPWSNDAVRDPHDEALYLRDEDRGLLWSPFPGPIPGHGPYEMRHGFGTSRCRHESAGLRVETDVFVHASDPVKIVRVRVVNPGHRLRRLSVTAYQRLVLGSSPAGAARSVVTWMDGQEHILFARTGTASEFADAVAFSAPVVAAPASSIRQGADREQFLGPGGSPSRPDSLIAGSGPDGRTGTGLEPCFCTQVRIDVAPGSSRECAFLLGEAASLETIEALVRRLRRPGALEAAWNEVQGQWAERLGRVQIQTPVESLDLLVNGWLAYQTLACRLWGRTAFYQSGGAFGFRDQLQDAAALLALDPGITRDQLLLHAAHQFSEGDVLHWWHPPRGPGIRTRFADDLLWLPLVTATYVRATGDARVLDERVPFLNGLPLGDGEDEALRDVEVGGETADLYQHCCRALERALATGPHGLPLFGSGDWNDGMNRVGRGGRGESVWMAFFLFAVIEEFVPFCEQRGDGARASLLRDHQKRLRVAVEHAAWDGAWYRRGYYDDGVPLGSVENDECRIDALVQAWSVLSGAATGERAEQALDAVERHLVSWEDGLVRLLTPPFDRTAQDPGYIKGYVPGVRENGGQYTHAALWVVAAMARLGRREHAARLLECLSPIAHSRTPDDAVAYQVEPYAVAADVYTAPEHLGRGGWTWYTGSSGWMLRVALESVLGMSLEGGDTLLVRAAIPGAWPGFRARLRPWGRRGSYDIEVMNESTEAARVVEVSLDDVILSPTDGVARVPLSDDGLDHRVKVRIR